MPSDAKPSLTPKLRFPEFRDGPGWKAFPLEEVSKFVGERVPVSQLDRKNYVSTENLLPDFGGLSLASSFPAAGTVVRYQENDILAANIRPYLKKIWLADRNGGASNDVIVIRAKSVDNVYLSQVLKNDRFVVYVMSGAKGLKMPRGDVALIRKYLVPTPTPCEQQKIADCLGTLDELIGAESQKLDALKAHKKGLMQQIFPREGETRPRLRFPEFQNAPEWDCGELSTYLNTVIDYRGKAPPKSNSGIPLITAKNVRFGWLDMSNDEYIEADQYDAWMTKGIPQGGDILFTTEAPLGNVAQFPNEGRFALGQRIITLRTDSEKCLPGFLFQSLLSPVMQKVIDFHSTGSTAKGIKSSVFVSVKFCAPKIQEQHRIATSLSSLDDLIAAQSDKLEALKTHKKGLMQQLFPSPTEAGA